MRLIDANKVEIGFEELCQSPYFKSDVDARHGAETLMDLCVRSDSHKPNTIDPETLPIVQELREQLSKVTSERDSLLKEMAGECGLCKYYDDCIKNHYSCGGYEWEWRGIE